MTMEERTRTTQTMKGWTVKYRDFKRREVKGISEQDLMDYMENSIILEITDENGNAMDVHDLYQSEFNEVAQAVGEGLLPNGRSGSRRR